MRFSRPHRPFISPRLLVVVSGISLLQFSCTDSPIPPPSRGPQWVVFRAPGAPLLNNRVNDICAHRNGQVWVTTDSGAAFYFQGAWGVVDDSLKYTIYSNSPPYTSISSKVNCVTAGKDGSVWFGLAGGGIRRYVQGTDNEKLWFRYQAPLISFNVISGISCEDVVNGDIWATTLAAGVNRFIPSSSDPRYGSWRTYTVTEVPEFGTNILEAVEVNPLNQSAWIASQLKLAVYLNEISGWRQVDVPAQFDRTIVSIAFDATGRMWMGMVEGVSTYDQDAGRWAWYSHTNTGGRLPAGRVNAILTNGSDLRWFGTNAGLVKFQDTTWTTINRSTLPLLPSDTVTSFAYDRRGNLWIGTTDGIVVYNPDGTSF
jgi:ligand-binding sensor domain-containing protein